MANAGIVGLLQKLAEMRDLQKRLRSVSAKTACEAACNRLEQQIARRARKIGRKPKQFQNR